MGTNTSLFSFYKPGDHESGYTSTLNANWDSLDSLINDRARKTAANTFTAAQTFSDDILLGTDFVIDHETTGGGIISTINIRARGSSDCKALLRLMPTGDPGPDRSEFTLMGNDVDDTDRWWADQKVTDDDGTLRRWHLLTDANGTAEPITRLNVQIDGENESALDEEFTVSRNGWAGDIEAATGAGNWMLRIVAGVGVTALENNAIDLDGQPLILAADGGLMDVVFHAASVRPWSSGSSTLGAAAQPFGNAYLGGAILHTGTTIGWFGTTPVAKQTVTGSRGGNAALASLLTALANYGYITNSSSA